MIKGLISSYLWRVLQFFFKSITPLFINFYAAKVLLPESYGNVIYALTLLSVINLLSNFGISSSVIKESAELSSKGILFEIKNIFPSVAFLSISITFFLILLVLIFVDNIPVFYYWSIPYLIFNPLTAILDGIFVGTKDLKKMSLVTVSSSLILLPVSFFLINHFKEEGMIISYSLFYLILFIFYFVVYPHKKGRFNKQVSLKILNYAVVIGLGSISFFLYSRVDIFILKKYNYIVSIGNYELIMRVFELTNIPIVLLTQVLAPEFVNLSVNKKFTELIKKARLLSGLAFVLGVFLLIALYFILPFLIQKYYPEYNTQDFNSILLILILTIPLKFVGIFMTLAVLTPLGYGKIVTYTTFIFGILNIILDFIFVDLFGFIGIFYATFLVHNINIIIQYLLFMYKFKKEKL